jgi:fumarate hydratase class II
MGEMNVPSDALYGAQTARAVENFPVSGRRLHRELVEALALIKYEAACVNQEFGVLDPSLAKAITTAASEIVNGKWHDHFPVDVFQTGSGTSSNMNMNEVIANRANVILGHQIGSKHPVHPNDHVNLGQSSNDVFPSAIHVAAYRLIRQELLPELSELEHALHDKADAFHDIIKIGRTHLQDATPIRLGQEFAGYAHQVVMARLGIETASKGLQELAIGGTAVGTGLNTHPEFGSAVARALSRSIGLTFKETSSHFAAQAYPDAIIRTSSALRLLAASLTKIANDIRWLGSGPRGGLGELLLPPVQPGSSIMPGKVNPVIAESILMACAQVIGYDGASLIGAMAGNFELNTMLPLLGHNLIESANLLTRSIAIFREKLLSGLKANEERVRGMAERSLAMATALAPIIGYDKAAEISKKAYMTNRTVREIAEEEPGLREEDLTSLLDPAKQT